MNNIMKKRIRYKSRGIGKNKFTKKVITLIDKKNEYLFDKYSFNFRKDKFYLQYQNKNGTVYFHQKVLENLIRYINVRIDSQVTLHVHHINGKPLDNYKFNLMVLTQRIHAGIHGKGKTIKDIKRGIKKKRKKLRVFIDDDLISFQRILNIEEWIEAHLVWAMIEYAAYNNVLNLIYCSYLYQYDTNHLCYIIDELLEGKEVILDQIVINAEENNIKSHINDVIKFIQNNKDAINESRKINRANKLW